MFLDFIQRHRSIVRIVKQNKTAILTVTQITRCFIRPVSAVVYAVTDEIGGYTEFHHRTTKFRASML